MLISMTRIEIICSISIYLFNQIYVPDEETDKQEQHAKTPIESKQNVLLAATERKEPQHLD